MNVAFWSSDTSLMVAILPPRLVSGIIEPLQWVIGFIVLVLVMLSLPILFYVINFGNNFSEIQADWAAFGSFLGGIYSPIIGAATLLLLGMQYWLQRQVVGSHDRFRLMSSTTHMIEESLDGISEELASMDKVQKKDLYDLVEIDGKFDSDDTTTMFITRRIKRLHPNLDILWSLLDTHMNILFHMGDAEGHDEFMVAYKREHLRCMARVNNVLCRALENYTFLIQRRDKRLNHFPMKASDRS